MTLQKVVELNEDLWWINSRIPKKDQGLVPKRCLRTASCIHCWFAPLSRGARWRCIHISGRRYVICRYRLTSSRRWYNCSCPYVHFIRIGKMSRILSSSYGGAFQVHGYHFIEVDRIGTLAVSKCSYSRRPEIVASRSIRVFTRISSTRNQPWWLSHPKRRTNNFHFNVSTIGSRFPPGMVCMSWSYAVPWSRYISATKVIIDEFVVNRRWLGLSREEEIKLWDQTMIFSYGPRVCLGKEYTDFVEMLLTSEWR